MTWERPEWVWAGEGGGFGLAGEGGVGGVEEVMRRWRSLISSCAVSVYRGADLTTLRATCRFILRESRLRRRSGIRKGPVVYLLLVFCQPHGGKMAPAQFADDDVPVVRERVADFDRVVTALDIVLPVLLVFCHDGSRVRRIGTVRHDITRYQLMM